MKQATQQRMTRQQVLDSIFKQVHGQRTRVVQLSVPGREITLAHVIGKPDPSVYTNLWKSVFMPILTRKAVPLAFCSFPRRNPP